MSKLDDKDLNKVAAGGGESDYGQNDENPAGDPARKPGDGGGGGGIPPEGENPGGGNQNEGLA